MKTLKARIQELEKRLAVEIGPHGGRIMGKTKTGKPIYESKDHPEHQNFSPEDHQELARVHDHHRQATEEGQKAGRASVNRDQGTVSHHTNWFRKFRDHASAMGSDKGSLQKSFDDGYKSETAHAYR